MSLNLISSPQRDLHKKEHWYCCRQRFETNRYPENGHQRQKKRRESKTENRRLRKRLSGYSKQEGSDDVMVGWGRWIEDWWRQRKRWKRKERGEVILSVTVLLSSVQDMTLIVPYQSIIIISDARIVRPASVCLDWKHQSQMAKGGRGVKPSLYASNNHPPSWLSTLQVSSSLSFQACIINIVLLSISGPPPLFVFSFHRMSSSLFHGGSTSPTPPVSLKPHPCFQMGNQ